jgi:hypothetical protein
VSLSGSTRRLGFASESSSWSAHETTENESRVLWRSPAGASEIGCSGDSAGDATQGQVSPHWHASPQQETFESAATLIDAPAIDPAPKRGATQPSALNSTARIVAVMCTERARIGSENLRSSTLSHGRDRSAGRLKDGVKICVRQRPTSAWLRAPKPLGIGRRTGLVDESLRVEVVAHLPARAAGDRSREDDFVEHGGALERAERKVVGALFPSAPRANGVEPLPMVAW